MSNISISSDVVIEKLSQRIGQLEKEKAILQAFNEELTKKVGERNDAKRKTEAVPTTKKESKSV